MSYYRAPGSFVLYDAEIGENSSIWYNAVVRGDNGPIRIGKNTNIQDNCTLHASPGFPLTIEDGVTIGHNAVIHGCYIGSNTLVGMGAIIMNGARIGSSCIVAAGALVTKNKVYPDGVLIMGTPAKVVRALSDDEIASNRTNAESYVSAAKKELQPCTACSEMKL